MLPPLPIPPSSTLFSIFLLFNYKLVPGVPMIEGYNSHILCDYVFYMMQKTYEVSEFFCRFRLRVSCQPVSYIPLHMHGTALQGRLFIYFSYGPYK